MCASVHVCMCVSVSNPFHPLYLLFAKCIPLLIITEDGKNFNKDKTLTVFCMSSPLEGYLDVL